MTATITAPPGALNLVRTDPKQRQADYLKAFRFYLGVPTKVLGTLIFVDNSDSDLTQFREIATREAAGKRVEIIGFYGLDYPPEYGRGYGEFKLIDRTLQDSRHFQALGPDDHFWKVTGRLMVLNFSHLVSSEPDALDFYGDFKTFRAHWLDTRLFAVSLGGYRRLLLGMYEELSEVKLGGPAEICLLRHLLHQRANGSALIVPRFTVQPVIAGFSGATNADYLSTMGRLRTATKAAMRRLAPHVWL
jgi:hypothetical protein